MDDDNEEELREYLDISLLKMPTGTKNNCLICGIYCGNSASCQRHMDAHKTKTNWRCSICGAYFSNCFNRSSHELKTHNFKRYDEDQEAVVAKIRKNQLSQLLNVGFNLVKTQSKAIASKAPGNELGDQDATFEELTELMEKNPASPLIKQTTCKICGIICGTSHAFQQHMDNHKRKNGSLCSLCGIQAPTSTQRNFHERAVHNFRRARFDADRSEAVKVKASLLSKLKNVGLNFQAVQKNAFHGEVGSLCKAKTRKPHEESDIPDQTFSQRVLRKRPKPPQIDVVSLEDSEDESSLPKQEIRRSAPSPPQTIPPSVQAPTPQVVPPPFGPLPVHIYANSKKCEILILRLDSDQYCAPLVLDDSFGRLSITDRSGNFVCFAKEYSQKLVSKFSVIFMSKPLTFVQMIQKTQRS
ncbi:hypothetical protein M3Y98_01025300 [Aphelenchoides besseyi]|nr:hypothetical protein M3Y98_01025300 [Aphelenchoides besseyi]